MSNTNEIRALCSQILAKCDEIDSSETESPEKIVLSPVNCLNGTIPPSTGMYPDEESEVYWLNKRSEYRTAMANSPSGSIVFIGDSMIERGDFTDIAPNTINLGISGESSRQLQYRINELDSNNAPNIIQRAGAVVILTGVNDLSDGRNGSPNNAADTVKIVLDRIIGWTSGRVIICKVIPVDANVFSIPTNGSIARLNGYIDAYASLPHVKVVDVNAILAPNGSLLPINHVDGQHLSPLAYDILKDEILNKLMEWSA